MNESVSRSVRVCLFDLYDTLVYFQMDDYQQKADAIAKLCDVSADEFVRAWESLVTDSNLGHYPRTEDRAREAFQRLGRALDDSLAARVAEVEHHFLRECSNLFEDSIVLLNNLKRLNLRLGLVTNASPSVWEVIRSKRLEMFFDAIVVSSEVGIRKPDPGIYYEALRRLNVWASETVFIGDGNDCELEGAHRAGFTTIKVNHAAFRVIQSEQSDEESVNFMVDSLSQIPQILNLEASSV